MILVDTNILIDIATKDSTWALWSLSQLETASLSGPLLINDVVYAELSVRYERIEHLDDFLGQAEVEMVPLSKAALFLAGKVFAQYRRSGGLKTGVMPDFFIGAHAATSQIPLLTRDTRRYGTYFPGLTLIAPPGN